MHAYVLVGNAFVKDFYQLLDSFARAKYREENLE